MAASAQMIGAVLTGGESRRMGVDKASLRLAGERLGARAVRALRGELERVVVVSRQLGEHADFGADEIADLRPGNGPLGGLHAALVHAAGRPVFALACDLPAVGGELIRHLIDAAVARRGSSADAWAVIPSQAGRRQPLCAVYSPSCLGEIESRLAEGELRMLDLVSAIDATVIELGPELAFYRPDLLENVNDLEAARRSAVSSR